MASPKPIFGCASIGHSYRSKTQVVELSQTLEKVGVDHLDTAARYPPTSPGLSEQLLGEAQASHSFLIDTKILVSGDGRGSLTEEAIGRSIKQSYDSLGASRINILYCHAPDKQTRIAAQAAAFDKYHRDGKFSHLGVSNFSIDMLEEWIRVADKEGYIKPVYYQGQYNLLCRECESGLLPYLRKHNIHFNAFSPLAGGFLTGKLTPRTPSSELVGTRFEAADNNPFGRAARRWYDKPSMHDANDRLRSIAQAEKTPMEELALRWLFYHSALQEGDGVIIGASKPTQAERTMQMIGAGRLSESLVRQLSELSSICGADAETIVTY